MRSGDDAVVHSPPAPASRIVGIGASAGGLEALEQFFDNLPVPAGMAFVVVQHLSPDFKSMMDELLARHTALPVHLVEDGMRVEEEHVYVIPPGKEMIVSGGRLLLSERDKQPELTLPIDTFFRSLAQDCGDRAVAIVLSGAGSDGSRGIRDVHDAGGMVIVQDTDSAQFDGMPRKALDAGVAKWVLPPREMPRVLLEHTRSARASQALPESGLRPPQTRGLDAVYDMLERRVRHRLHPLQAEHGDAPDRAAPRALARRQHRPVRRAPPRRSAAELDSLYRDLLIGVTRFFRNEAAFEVLEHQILPDLLRRGPRRRPAARLGRGLRHRRGGVLARHRRARGSGPLRLAPREDLRDRRAPRLARARGARRLRRAGARERPGRPRREVLPPHRERVPAGRPRSDR